MKWKLDRIISVATLVTSVAALVLVLKKPAPVAPAQSPTAAAANVESVEKKLEQLDQPKEPGQAPAQVRFNSDEITAALAQAAAALPKSMTASAAMAAPGAAAQTGAPTSVPASPDAVIGEGEPQVKDYKVDFDGDVARGQFVTQKRLEIIAPMIVGLSIQIETDNGEGNRLEIGQSLELAIE